MEIERTVRFKKDWKRMKKRGADLSKLIAALQTLCENQTLPGEHALSFGEYNGLRDAHISPDWILLYEIQDGTIILHRTGTHSDLNL